MRIFKQDDIDSQVSKKNCTAETQHMSTAMQNHQGWGRGRVAALVDNNCKIKTYRQIACRLYSTFQNPLGDVPDAVTAIRLAATRSCIRTDIV